jgi:hypothetical protein
MTHEELLARIVNYPDAIVFAEHYRALRAVMELHQPTPDKKCIDWLCQGCSMTEINLHINYPCPTIQAIEKVLL